MTAAAFDQSVTDEINRRVAIYARQDNEMGYRRCIGCGQMTGHSHRLHNGDLVALCGACILDGQVAKLSGEIEKDIPPHIAKITLRCEVRDLLQAAEIYDEQAARHAGEAAKCAELARCAREQAANLKLMGDL